MKKRKFIGWIVLIVCCIFCCFAFVSCKKEKTADDGGLTYITVAGTFNIQTYQPITNGYIYKIEWELYSNREIKAKVWTHDNVLGTRMSTLMGQYLCAYNGSNYAIAYSFDESSQPSVVSYYGTYIQTSYGDMELVGANSRGEFEGIVARVSYTMQSDSYGCEILGDTLQYVIKGENALSVTAKAYEAYEFIGWSDGVQTATRTDVAIQENLSVQALFRKVKDFYFLDYAASEGGSIQGEVNQTVLKGESATMVTALPEPGFEFTGWSDGLQTAERKDINIQGNISVVANFEIIKTQYTFIYEVDGEGGRIQGETQQTIFEDAYGSTVTAVPDEGYEFIGWYDNIGGWISGEMSLTPYAAWWEATTVYYARFQLIEYTYTYTVQGGGTLVGEISGSDLRDIENTISIHNNYTAETITAVPDEGYYFVGWSDGIQTPTRQDKNEYSDIEVTAIFVHYCIFVFEVDGEGGCIQGETYQGVFDGEYGTTVTAIPDEGYYFVGWYEEGILVEDATEFTPYATGWYSYITYYALFERIE